jgi:hypothetical protein
VRLSRTHIPPLQPTALNAAEPAALTITVGTPDPRRVVGNYRKSASEIESFWETVAEATALALSSLCRHLRFRQSYPDFGFGLAKNLRRYLVFW